MKHVALSLGAVVLGVSASTSAQVVNGTFSSGLTGWTWTADANAEPAMVATTAAGPLGSGNAFRVNPGGNAGGIEAGGTLSQNLVLSGGVNYSVTGDLAIQALSANADGGTIAVRLGGTLLHTFDLGQVAAGIQFSAINANFVPPAAGSYALELRFTRGFPNFAGNVLHWADNLSVVPAPGSAMVLAGLGLAAARRRRA